MVATDASELAKKAVGSAIKSAKLNNAKIYAVNVIAPGKVSVTQRDSKDIEWKKQVKELLEAQGRETTAYAKTAGKIVNVTVEPVIL
ncbi:MAG: universal stress protein, partial [Syntrophothermus sp.]